MTDTSSLPITHATTDPYPVPAPLGSPGANGAISDSVAPDEEEPYTIKCICLFDEDDGSTVFCEGCETWQHIVCYYPDKRVPDVHNCVDCEPRLLDSRRANDRQRQRRVRDRSEDGDRKRRPGVRAPKKKSKDGDVNGSNHQRGDSGPRDQPPAKKAKVSHRSSASIGALTGAPTIPADSRKRRSSTSVASSPTKPPGPSIPLYSNEFLHLYDRDEDHVDMDSNLFVNVSLVGDTASWVKDPEALARVAPGRRSENIFNRSDTALDRSRWPNLTTETVTDSSIDVGGRHPTWKIVKTRDAVQKDEIVGEITGKVGDFDDYCRDPSNRWADLHHPEPFVFFSSHLPLYIDSRHEGSGVLRYTRRSCRPNVTMKIFITNDVEYHFCFIAKEDIQPNTEITIMWYLDTQFSESANGLVKQEAGDGAMEPVASCISNTLANFGGCACEFPQTCLLANLDRRRHPKLLESTSKQTNIKRKKTKTKSTASPQDTNLASIGRASISRAGSETTKHPDEDDAGADSRSTSGSARGQPRSRDLSPNTQGPELSSRERRKVADVEKQFEQLENNQRSTTSRKKKRVSGTSAQSPTGQTGYSGSHPVSKTLHLDTSITHSRSSTMAGSLPVGRHGSPRKVSGHNTPFSRSPLARPIYVDAAIQADADVEDDPSPPPQRRVSFVPMTIRLLQRFRLDRQQSEEIARQQLSSAGSDSVGPIGSLSPSLTQSPATGLDKPDVPMWDVGTLQSPLAPPTASSDVEMRDFQPDAAQANEDLSKPPIPPPWPSTAAHNTRIPTPSSPLADRGNLRVAMPPPSIPAIPPTMSPGSASTASPTTFDTSPLSTMPAAPSSLPTPTPAKKKLSLGDYLSRRGTMATTPTSEKSQGVPPPQKSPSTPGSGPAASIDGVNTPKTSPDGKAEPVGPSDAMKDAPDSTHPRVPSISS